MDNTSYRISDKFVNMKPSAIREIFKSLGKPDAISFAAGNPAPESFPIEEMREISDGIFKSNAVTALQYGITEGYVPLRKLVSERLARVYNINGKDDDTIIVTGGQQGIELTCKVMCNEGDVVICENPSFIGALNSFRSLGAKLVGVDMCDEGMVISSLEKALDENPNAKIIYTIPNFHNPLGITSTLENRKAVYELAKKHNVIIIEDNPYGDLRFEGENVPTFKSMDTDGIVVYCGSFSKIISSGMRIGFVNANKALISKMVIAKQVEDVHTNVLFQMIVAEYMEKYDLDRHIESIRKLYANKAGLMLKALDEYMPKCVKYTRPQGGIFLWCTLPDCIELDEFIDRCKEKNVFVVPGTAFLPDESQSTHSFRLNYSMPSDEEIEKGIKLLADIVKDML